MELFLTIIILLILAETTFLVTKTSQRPRLTSNQTRKLYIDTSALMDPRLVAVAETGFLSGDLIVPRSVLHELQLLADGKDHDKRLRARAGLDAVRELERVVFFNLTILDDELDRTPVDNRLLELAKNNHGSILTNDFNLKKVAAAEHIDALSLNELALVLRNEYLPGEHTRVKIISAGSGANQGVAYLKDGTMVVVDQASKRIGEEVEVEFVRLNQTAAGSMMFAKLVPEKTPNPKPSNSKVSSGTKSSGSNPLSSTRTSNPKVPLNPKISTSAKNSLTSKTPANSKSSLNPKNSKPRAKSSSLLRKTSSRSRKLTPEDSLIELVSAQNSSEKPSQK